MTYRELINYGYGFDGEFYVLRKPEDPAVIIYSGGIGRVIYRSVGLYQCRAVEAVVAGIVFGHGDVERALDALVLLKLQCRPLLVVEKLLQRLLQVLKHRLVRALNLLRVEVDLGLQFLGTHLLASYEAGAKQPPKIIQ